MPSASSDYNAYDRVGRCRPYLLRVQAVRCAATGHLSRATAHRVDDSRLLCCGPTGHGRLRAYCSTDRSIRSTVRSVPLTVAAASCTVWATAYGRSVGETDLQVLDAFLPVAVEVVRADRLPEVRFDKRRPGCHVRQGKAELNVQIYQQIYRQALVPSASIANKLRP